MMVVLRMTRKLSALTALIGISSLLFTASPATAVPNGTVACTGGGTFTVNANIVTTSTGCTGRANIPGGIIEIADDAFLSATGLTSAYVPNTVTRIGEQAFQQSGLTTVDFQSGSTLTTIDSAAFQNIPLTSIVIPDSVTELGNYQFWVSNSLTSVVLSKNLTVLRQYVFGNMASLNSVTLPIGLPSIEANAFAAVPALTSYTYCGTKLSSANLTSGGLGSKTRNCVAPQIALSSTSESVAPNTAITGYTISSPNGFGGGVVDYSISPNISTTPGLAFDTATGLISGTPTTIAASQTYTISANNFASPSGTATYAITVASPTPPPAPPIPSPPQRSNVTGISPDNALAGKATPVVVSGTFNEEIVNISINGNLLPAGSWTQEPTKISFTIPNSPAGRYTINLYNGSVPLLATQTFTYKAPGDLVWTLQAPPNRNAWNSVAFGNGTFVAVGPSTNGDGVMRSTDGKNWIVSPGVPNNTWTSVTYGNGIFVAVASTGVGNRIMWSKDGVQWTISETSRDLNWGLVKFGNGVFVAAVKGILRLPAVLAYSSDGITWKTPTITVTGTVVPSQSVTTLGFGSGVFVLTGSPGRSALGNLPLLMTSRDGENWTWNASTIATSGEVALQTYGCETYVAINGITGRIDATKNPLRWPRGDYPPNPLTGPRKNLHSGTFAGGLFVTVGNGISTLSNNALLWRAQELSNANTWSSVAYGNGTFVAVASLGADHRVMTAPYTPLALSRSSETIALGSAIAGTTPQFTGCATPNYSISPSIAGTGLSFNSTTGELSGTPTAARSETIYTISAIDGSEVPASATFALTVTGAVASTENSNPSSEPSTTAGTTTPATPKPETSTEGSGNNQTPATENTSTGATTQPSTPTAPTTSQSTSLRLKLYFDMASYTLTATNRAKLQEFAKKLTDLEADVTITVTGFAQPTPGSELTDGALSLNRASQVAKTLSKLGVTGKIVSSGAGRAKANLPKSRYVEIVVNNSK